MRATVECYAGHRYPERPRAFVWEGERVTVEEVERSWRTPAGPAFRVRSADGRRFTLAYDEAADGWDVRLLPRTSAEMIRQDHRS
jgi:hypothetical protein